MHFIQGGDYNDPFLVEVHVVDSHQRQKAIRQLLALTADPNVASIARQMFGTPVVQEVPESPWRKLSAHWVIGIVAGVGVSYQADATVPLFARFSIVNNSNVKMPRTRVRCAINDVDFPGIKLARNSIEIVHPQEYNSPLDAGGDGETYDCPFDSQMNNGAVVHPVCADVTMYVEYALPFEPRGYPESKSVRLVTHKESDRISMVSTEPQHTLGSVYWGRVTQP